MAALAECTLTLNDKSMSALVCNGKSYPAFSGRYGGRNNPADAAVGGVGPIPPGLYYIVDRPVGGRIPGIEAWFHDLISNSDRAHWFALYAKGTLNDFTFVQGVKRGNFRLHPIGREGISEGCITINSQAAFDQLESFLRSQPPAYIPGTKIRYYGTVTVK